MGREGFYKPGSFYRVDERTGFVRRAEETRKEWTGSIVGSDVWEPRHPQDSVKGRADNQAVPEPRPVPRATYFGPSYYTMDAEALAQATVIPLESTTGLAATNRISLILDNGDTHRTTIASVSAGVSVTLNLAIPSKASSGNLLVNLDA